MVPARLLVRATRFLFALAWVLTAWNSTAAQAPAHEDGSQKISGFAVIDRVITTGATPVFRADGYTMRMNTGTAVRFLKAPASPSQVDTNLWVRYQGTRNEQGEVVLSAAEFIKPKLHKPKRDPKVSLAQVTTFPHGGMIDFDGSFRTDQVKYRMEDAGGACGTRWYPVPENAALQERVRRVGVSVVPQYQRDLPDDDPAKMHFRFYAIEEEHIRSGMGCDDGLVLVPASVVARMQNDSQLAAVLADGVSANLQQQNARLQLDMELIEAAGAIGVGFPAALTGETIASAVLSRKMEEQRGRMALALMADAGFDPWQAPEAWRILALRQLPKNLSKLKYPARSQYQLEILQLQYKHAANTANTQAADPSTSPR
jgi:hypothetical protein